MAEESKAKQANQISRPDPFILRLTSNFLKRCAYFLTVFCFASAILIGGFTVIAVIAGLTGWKPLDMRLISVGAMSTFILCLFGKWTLKLR